MIGGNIICTRMKNGVKNEVKNKWKNIRKQI